jgi:ABC-2 type transport system ATP-binding protein
MTDTATARLEHVTKAYGRTVALDSISCALQPGVIGLLGPNGAGKTTLLRLLSTVLPPSSGHIWVAEHHVTESRAARIEARRRIGYVPQEVTFPRSMTAFSFVDYIAVLKEWRQTRARHTEVQRVLELVDLVDKGAKKVRQLSGGQRRRLTIAQAMVGSPELLLLDEPTTGLDPEQRASLRRILSGLPGTVLLSTHQTEDVATLCDRVIVIDHGHFHFDGSVPELLSLASGKVYVGPEPTADAVQIWRTGTGLIRSVGGSPGVGHAPAEPSVEDAYLLLRNGVETPPQP